MSVLSARVRRLEGRVGLETQGPVDWAAVRAKTHQLEVEGVATGEPLEAVLR